MTYRKTSFGLDVKNNPKKATAALIKLLNKNCGNIVWLAEELGVSRMTAHRWINELGLVKLAWDIRGSWKGRKRRPACREQ